MNNSDSDMEEPRRFLRQPIPLTHQGLIRVRPLINDRSIPILIEAVVPGLELAAWAEQGREMIESNLYKYGAVLFRDFRVDGADGLRHFIQAMREEPLPYHERSSPRSAVGASVYTSTDYPCEHSIFLHSEQSYNLTFPQWIAFHCAVPATKGGETPIADCRAVLRRISPAVRRKFLRLKWMYVRNYGEGFGLEWKAAFQTTDRAEVADYCKRNGIECEWRDAQHLRTRQVRPTVATHPHTNEPVWFNHATFFHLSTLEPTIRDAFLTEFQDGNYPNNTYYGDGTPIESEVMAELRAAYLAEKILFPWVAGDVLLLDNILIAHGREPYSGPRSTLVAMARPINWKEAEFRSEDLV